MLDVRRRVLKQRLTSVALEYDPERATQEGIVTAEDLMKELENGLCPYDRPVEQAADLLHARWSFVFTGVPTIGMKLITLLSRLASHVRLIEFGTVFLQVVNNNKQKQVIMDETSSTTNNGEKKGAHTESRVDAIVQFRVATVPMELVVQTLLEPNTTFPFNDGTHLIETFKGVLLNGVHIPTPTAWHSSRDLHVQYLDEEMMIARTAGGEPHLLLRHSSCTTEDDEQEECNIDEDLTQIYAMAQSTYGQDRLTRSLVDRDYAVNKENDPTSIFKLLHSIFSNPGGHD